MDNIREFINRKTSQYDSEFNSLKESVTALALAIKALTTAIDAQTAANKSFYEHWKKAVPIGLVFWLVALMVGGQTAVGLIRFFLP